MLYRPELPIHESAIEAFLRKRAGKEALFREFERLVLEPVFSVRTFGDLDLEETLLGAIIWNTDSHASYVEWYPPRQYCLQDLPLDRRSIDDAREERRAVNERLSRLAGAELRSPRFPHLRFRSLSPAQALKACPRVSPEIRVGGEDEGSRSTMGRV